MKKMMIACCLAVGSLWAKPELAVTAELASFGDISKKTTMLGSMINNPIVPTLLLGTGQQQLAKTYGRFRSDAPMYWQFYADTAAISAKRKSGTADFDIASHCEYAVIYPGADGPAKMLLNNPGSEKLPDGTLHIKAYAENTKERWVKFSADGTYCAIADSAELANRAIADFEIASVTRRARVNKARPIARLDIHENGIAFFAEMQNISNDKNADMMKETSELQFVRRFYALQTKKSKKNELNKFSGATIVIDLDSNGIFSDCEFKMKNEQKIPAVAGQSIPAGALDAMTADTFIFLSSLTCFQSAYAWNTEADFKADMNDIAEIFRTDIVADVKACKELKRYAAVLEELCRAVSDFFVAMDFPAVDDWSSIAFSFNSSKHPYVLSNGKVRNASKANALGFQLMDRVAAALEKQWPGSKIITKSASGHVIDWAAAVDVGVVESDGEKDAKFDKAVKNAKETLKSVLGNTKTEIISKATGDNFESSSAVPGFTRPAIPSVGEARVAAALPETRGNRPGFVFYFPLYAFAREVVLPIMEKQASKQDAQQYNALIKAMPPVEENSAIASAGWIRKDGSVRAVVRITANEIKNYGAAFNAFTAASMIGNADDDKEDE